VQLQLAATRADFSGAGFSTIFARPPYQQSVVSHYLQNLGDQYQGLYRCVCRCCDLRWACSNSVIALARRAVPSIPDVSVAQANEYTTFFKGQVQNRRGTDVFLSSSPPLLNAQLTGNVQTVAGIISLLRNDCQLSINQPRLGFLNPWLYG
jgi:tripeptidyl-peptidase-1